MFGFTVPFFEAHRRIDGAIPRQTDQFGTALEIPLARDAEGGTTHERQAAGPFAGLGLPEAVAKSIENVVKAETRGATNEVDFRRGVMSHLFDRRLPPTTRRVVMAKAIELFRSTYPTRSGSAPVPIVPIAPSRRPTSLLSRVHDLLPPSHPTRDYEATEKSAAPRGGTYHRRIPKKGGGYTYVYDEASYRSRPDAHLDGKEAAEQHLHEHVRRIASKHAGNPEGCPVEEFAPLVARHGHAAVAAAIHRHAPHAIKNKRIHFAKSDGDGGDSSTSGENLPKTSGGGHASEKNLPPGARRIWHNRVVEKLADGKWHVVGHIAGLEDPKKQRPPALAGHEIDPAARAALFKLIAQHAAQSPKP